MHAELLQSCLTLWPHGLCSPPGSSVHGDSPGKNTGVGCHTLLQDSWPRDWTCVSCVFCIANGFFTNEPLGKPFKSPQTAANESTLYSYWSRPIVLEPCSPTREASAMRSPCTERKDNSHSLKLEKAYTQQLRSSTTKKKKKKNDKEIWSKMANCWHLLYLGSRHIGFC